MLVYDPINDKWQALITDEPNSRGTFVYQLTTNNMQEKNRNFANIAKSNGTLLVYKDQEAGSRVFVVLFLALMFTIILKNSY